MSGRPVVSQHHSFVLAVDGADATRPVSGKGAVLMHAALHLMVYGAAVSQKYSFVPSNFCAPIKVAPVARAMPAIP